MNLPLLRGQGLPEFEQINAGQVDRAIPALLAELHAELDRLEAVLQQATTAPLQWDEVMEPLHHLGERLRWSWGVVSHLHGVCNTPELREAHQRQQGAVVAFGSRAGQSQVIHGALQQLLRQHDIALAGQNAHLDATQLRILRAELRDMELRGVGLQGAEQEAFNAATTQLAQLASDFGNHLLDATSGWTLRLSDPHEVAGLPTSLRELLAQAARQAEQQSGDAEATAAAGPWLIGLDMPRVVPFLQYSQRRDLRETVYRAQVARASSGELDNTALI
ncbi:MAG: M3 family metallopeptidase, partial [Cyanobacteria bacterium K_DeepCast_35m_m2_023]|nr:M3 family metallopeptidase [Cyanobacteria bacterium K_DeepCast_35m_m2_023]